MTKKSTTIMTNNTEYQVPLIDRQQFFGNPQIIGGSISPDGNWISFLKEYNGILNIWLKRIDEPFEKAVVLTNSDRPLYNYFWTDDGKYIIYGKDNDGDENSNIYAIEPTKASNNKLPPVRNLIPNKKVNVYIYRVSDNNPDLMLVGINDRDPAWHDLYQLNIATGKLTKLYTNNDRITDYEFDWDDNLRILYRTDTEGNTEILRINSDKSLTSIYTTNVKESAVIRGWTPDNKKIYFTSNKGEINLSTLYLMDIESLEITKVESDPENKVDFGGLSFDNNSREIIASSYTADKTKYYWKNKKWKGYFEYLQQQFPERQINFTSATKDYSKLLFSVGGDKYASEVYLFDTKDKSITFQYTPRPELKKIEQYLAPMQPIRYSSSDGLEIPAYLTLPTGKISKNLPLVVLVHGGPKGPRDYWGYDSIAQFLANRGYAILQPNFRASGGYGKKFLNAGDLQWGKLMQDDITWGVKYLIDKKIADPNKVVIMGGSYGGYATLAGLAFTPKLYAAGVDVVGPSNLFTLLESIPDYWESGRASLYAMVGDPNTEEGRKRIKEASPLFYADQIERPLLIVQGKNDPRVKQAEADQIVIALRDKGKQVDYLLADDEGHGFAKPVNNMAMYAEIEKFLAGILQGRYQKDMPEDVAKRLEQLRVDVNKVTYQAAKK